MRRRLYAYPTYSPLRTPCCESGHKGRLACAAVRSITMSSDLMERIPITRRNPRHSVQ
jgi:hypothetical protein